MKKRRKSPKSKHAGSVRYDVREATLERPHNSDLAPNTLDEEKRRVQSVLRHWIRQRDV